MLKWFIMVKKNYLYVLFGLILVVNRVNAVDLNIALISSQGDITYEKFDVKAGETIGQLKQKIEEFISIPAFAQQLVFFNGSRMEVIENDDLDVSVLFGSKSIFVKIDKYFLDRLRGMPGKEKQNEEIE